MSKIFSIKNLLLIIIALFLFSFINSPVLALQSATNGLAETANVGYGGEVPKETSLAAIIGKVVGVALSFVGVIFLILIIYAGFTWMLARGNEAETKKAKDLMYDAVLGLIIIMAAYAITSFVGNQLPQ